MTRGANPVLLLFGPLVLLFGRPPATAQVIVPDRLPNGKRMTPVTTTRSTGTLPFDTVAFFPGQPETRAERPSWWLGHALFLDGPVRVALDPIVDYRIERSRFTSDRLPSATDAPRQGRRNIRGVRYAGDIDRKVSFGGTVLEMQRTLVGPDAEWTLAAEAYPGMGSGKLRPGEAGLFTLDHSLAQVWFNAPLGRRVTAEWGLGSAGLGPGTRNLLWNPNVSPAPYLLLEGDLGNGWAYRWFQQRQRDLERLPADGAREGRYAPLGLAIRTISKAIEVQGHPLHLNFLAARWSSVLDRGEHRPEMVDWVLHLAPWPLLPSSDTTRSVHLAGHQGLDVQWRRPRSTWYGQWRATPFSDPRYRTLDQGDVASSALIMIGHVRHGARTDWWVEYAPAKTGLPPSLDPGPAGGHPGVFPWSAFQPDWVIGGEWRPAGCTVAGEWGRLEAGQWTAKGRISLPAAVGDATSMERRMDRRGLFPNRLLPPLVPIGIHFEFGTRNGHLEDTWWSIGLSSPMVPVRKAY